MQDEILAYINRLSDLFFILDRGQNRDKTLPFGNGEMVPNFQA